MNVNDVVQVELTAAGRRQAKAMGEDPDQTRWQMWQLIQVFGSVTYLGMQEPMFVRNEITLLESVTCGCPNGLYRLHWVEGGTSVAAVGTLNDGTRWFAPTNWTGKGPEGIASTEWSEVLKLEAL